MPRQKSPWAKVGQNLSSAIYGGGPAETAKYEQTLSEAKKVQGEARRQREQQQALRNASDALRRGDQEAAYTELITAGPDAMKVAPDYQLGYRANFDDQATADDLRRSSVGAGNTPGADTAFTADRADDISARNAQENIAVEQSKPMNLSEGLVQAVQNGEMPWTQAAILNSDPSSLIDGGSGGGTEDAALVSDRISGLVGTANEQIDGMFPEGEVDYEDDLPNKVKQFAAQYIRHQIDQNNTVTPEGAVAEARKAFGIGQEQGELWGLADDNITVDNPDPTLPGSGDSGGSKASDGSGGSKASDGLGGGQPQQTGGGQQSRSNRSAGQSQSQPESGEQVVVAVMPDGKKVTQRDFDETLEKHNMDPEELYKRLRMKGAKPPGQ